MEIKKKSEQEVMPRKLHEKTFVHIVKDWNNKGSNYYVLRKKLHEEELKRKATKQKEIKEAEIIRLATKKKRLPKRVSPGYLKKLKRDKEKILRKEILREKWNSILPEFRGGYLCKVHIIHYRGTIKSPKNTVKTQ